MTRWLKLAAAAAVLSFGAVDRPMPLSAADGPDGSIGGLKAKFVDVNGVQARYYDQGQGESMVLIHGGSTGGSSTANVWSRNIPGLAKRFHVFAVDRLGSGLSGNPKDTNYETPAQVEFVYQFIRTLKLGRVHLVGHSAGGGVGFYLAADHPEIVRTLIIVAHGPEQPPAGDGPTKLDLSKCPDQNVYEGLRCRVEGLAWTPTTFDPEYWEADHYMAMQPKSKQARAQVAAAAGNPERAKQNAAYREQRWDRVRNAGVLQVPILIYGGKNDVLDWSKNDPTAMLRGELGFFDIVGAKNPKVQLIIVNEGGHFMYREHPEQFDHDVIGFVDFWAHQPAGAQPKTPSW